MSTTIPYLTRVNACDGEAAWVAKGSLNVHSVNGERFARLVHQTD